jgi:5'(3')-deoxyribonucleotidase
MDDVCAAWTEHRERESAKGRAAHEIGREAGEFRNLGLIEGAKEGVEFLDQHFEIYFVSTAMWSNPSCWTEKMLWVEEHFPKIGKKKLILTHNKGLFSGDYLIDDRIANGVGDFKGVHIHFGQAGFEDWKKVKDYFKKLIPQELKSPAMEFKKREGFLLG